MQCGNNHKILRRQCRFTLKHIEGNALIIEYVIKKKNSTKKGNKKQLPRLQYSASCILRTSARCQNGYNSQCEHVSFLINIIEIGTLAHKKNKVS